MRFSSQNLNEDRFGRKGPKWRHGRAWLYLAEGFVIKPEWTIFHRGFCHVGVEVGGRGDDHQFQVKLALPYLFSFWLSFGLHYRWWPFRQDYDFELAWHDGSIWWKIGADHWGERRYPRTFWSRLRDGSFNPMDFLFGRLKYSNVDLKTEQVQIPMYEGAYEATVKLQESTWVRPRWPWWPLTRKWQGANIDVPRGIGVPGKGENSWDCGEDAIFGMSCDAKTVPEAIGSYVTSVLRTRRRYGSKNWKPTEHLPTG